MIDKTLKFLTVAVITDTDDGYFRHLDASNKISHSTSISSRHTINLVHNQYSLRLLWAAILVDKINSDQNGYEIPLKGSFGSSFRKGIGNLNSTKAPFLEFGQD